jgi:hypothetical protein
MAIHATNAMSTDHAANHETEHDAEATARHSEHSEQKHKQCF